MKPMRSALYVPADNERALKKASQLNSDVIIFDLEDAVSTENKAIARKRLVNSLSENEYGKKVCVVRVNGIDSLKCLSDLNAIKNQPISAILFPKISTVDDIKKASSLLTEHQIDDKIALWAMMETALGILNCQAIIESCPRLNTLVMGTNDLAKELAINEGCDRFGLLHSLSHVVLCAKAFGLKALDGVHVKIKDAQGLASSCHQGKSLGFNGKTLIHPSQIPLCNQCFSPHEKEVKKAREIIELWQAMKHAKQGVATYQGELIEQLHVEKAQEVLTMHQNILTLEE